MLKFVILVLPFLLVVVPAESTTSDGIQKLIPTSAIHNKDGQQHQQRVWILSALDDVITRQSQRRSFLENYALKNPDEKMRSIAFREQMDKEEIVHLKQNIDQLREIADSFHHNTESSSHSVSKRQSAITNRNFTLPSFVSTLGNCVVLGNFCPHPDIQAPSMGNGTTSNSNDSICFSVQKSGPSSSKSQVQFEEVLLNLGESFNLKESVFVAPKSGIYEFNFDGHKTEKSEFLNISLRINGKDVVNAFSDFMERHDFRNLISMHSLLQVKKGDRVDLSIKQGALLHDYAVDGKNVVQHTQFTGKFLVEDATDPQRLLTPVYFNVQKNVGYCKPQSFIPFEIVYINVGEAFDLRGQSFICPIAGIYEFIVKGFKTGKNDGSNNDVLNLSLRLNGVPVANTMADFVNGHGDNNHNFHSSFSIHSILKVEKGDRIDLFLVKGCLYDDNNHLTQFTGKLLMGNAISSSNTTNGIAVYFNVQKNASFSTANAVIPFEVAVLNIGGAFSSNEHFFRAPKSGIYEFNAAGIKDEPQSNLHIALRLNGKPVTYVWAEYVPKHWMFTPFSLHYIMKVKVGDRIDLFNVGEGSMLFDDKRKMTHFTGKLLFPTNV